jgi:phospholipid transport system transporter-binding protein
MNMPSRPVDLTLEAGCMLRESADMQFLLLSAHADHDPVVVDGGAVERIDTAGLQLLVAFARRQADAGRRLEWQAASPELVKCSTRLGLIEALGMQTIAQEGPRP